MKKAEETLLRGPRNIFQKTTNFLFVACGNSEPCYDNLLLRIYTIFTPTSTNDRVGTPTLLQRQIYMAPQPRPGKMKLNSG